MIDRNQINEGMVVRSSDGKKLGRVLACKEGSFIVEKGFFFATDYVASYDDVAEISGDEIRLARPHEGLVHGERAVMHEGGLGESLTVGIASGLDSSRESWARAEEEEREARRGGTRGDEEATGPKYNLGEEPGSNASTHGDEGGGI